MLAAEGGRFISAAFEGEAKAKELGLRGDALRAWRHKYCAPHFAEFKAWSEVVKLILLPSDPLNKVLAYYKNHWDALLRFLDYPQIPIDNSATERLYQPVAKLLGHYAQIEGINPLKPLSEFPGPPLFILQESMNSMGLRDHATQIVRRPKIVSKRSFKITRTFELLKPCCAQYLA